MCVRLVPPSFQGATDESCIQYLNLVVGFLTRCLSYFWVCFLEILQFKFFSAWQRTEYLFETFWPLWNMDQHSYIFLFSLHS